MTNYLVIKQDKRPINLFNNQLIVSDLIIIIFFSSIPNASVNPNGTFYACWTFIIYLVFLYNAFVCVLFVFDDTREGSPFFVIWILLNGF